jgi:hypothetical protein
MSKRARLIWIAGAIALTGLQAEEVDNQKLAQWLSSADKRAEAIAIVSSNKKRIETLLSWTNNPPAHVSNHQLFIGLSDAFGILGVKESIPFLIKHIDIERWHDANTWLKRDEVVLERKPAMSALMKMGADASNALVSAYYGGMKPADQLAAVFVIARLHHPSTRGFLETVMAYGRSQARYAELGIAGFQPATMKR